MKKLLLTLLCFLTFFTLKSQDLLNLKPTGYVNDYEKVFTPAQKDTLEKILSDYEKKTSIEICVVTSADFDFQTQADKLAETWGVGKKDLNNGLLIAFTTVPGNHYFSVRTGYGLEEFLPDGKLNQFTTIMKDAFRSEDYYGGIKELVLSIQQHLGTDGYDMMLKNKELNDAKSKAATKAFFSGLLRVVLVLILLSGIGFLIYLQYKRKREFIKLKSEINAILTSIDSLRKTLGNLPKEIQSAYNHTINKLTNKLVSEDIKIRMMTVYNVLLDYKRVINSIDSSIDSLSKSKSDIENYLKDNYPYCSDYLKNELTSLLSTLNIDEYKFGEYDKIRMNKLIGVQTSLNIKLKSFLSKTAKINAIVVDNQNINKKIEDLNSQYTEYIRKKTILSGARIGKRYNSLINLDYNGHITKISSNINDSFNFIKDGNFESALLCYANYITTLAVVSGAFSSVDSLLNEYNKSVKYIKENESKLGGLVSKIDDKINKSGISHDHKSKYSTTKSEITKYNDAINTDVIIAAGLLATLVSSLTTVFSSVTSDISSYNTPSSYTSPSPSNDSFGGFSGGSFGGGGSSGTW